MSIQRDTSAKVKFNRRFQAFLVGIALSVVGAFAIGSIPGGFSGHGVAFAAPATVHAPVKNAAPKVPFGRQLAILSGGCFWSEQALFQHVKGVEFVAPGYAGGWVTAPTYEAVCTETTGHAETVAVTFDPAIISYHDLLHIFLTTMDPTTLNRQGADEGTSYRSAIWYTDADQQTVAKKVIAEVGASKVWPDPIVTQVSPYSNFFPAEAYHFDYYNLHPNEPYCVGVIAPKLAHFRALYPNRLQ